MDGVAPLAKMAQQRGRRFFSAHQEQMRGELEVQVGWGGRARARGGEGGLRPPGAAEGGAGGAGGLMGGELGPEVG